MHFSIITPSFRPGPWLRLCIASVADQRGVEVEHIVQDAGSDDGTLEWLTSDSRVKASVEPDGGMYDAINRGLRRASGDILAYLNCDEQYLPGALVKVEAFFRAHPEVEVLFGDAVLLNQNGQPVSYRRMVLPGKWHVRFAHLPTLTCSTFFRRSIIEAGYFFDPSWKALGDAEWIYRLLARGTKMATLPKPLAAFTFTGANLGASEQALRETHRLRGGAWPQVFVPFLSLAHRLRKWRAGAYRPRSIDCSLYTLRSPDNRQRFITDNLGYGWPQPGKKNSKTS